VANSGTCEVPACRTINMPPEGSTRKTLISTAHGEGTRGPREAWESGGLWAVEYESKGGGATTLRVGNSSPG